MAISSRRIPVVEVIVRDELSRSLQQTQRRLRQELGRGQFRPLEQGFLSLGRAIGIARAELGSLLGLTGLSAFLGGGLVAGVAKLTQSLGDLARSTQQIHYTAAAVGLTAKQFETLAARGQNLGLSAEESRGQIANLARIIDELVVKGPQASRFKEIYEARGGPAFLNRVRQQAQVSTQAGIEAFLGGMSDVQDRRGQAFVANFAGLSFAWKDALKISESELGEIYQMSAPAMRAYNLELLKLNRSYDNVKKEVAVAMMPAVTGMIQAFDKFLQGPGGQIAKDFGAWLGSININWEKVGDKIIAIINAATKFIETVDPIVQKMGGWPTILTTLGVALGVAGLGGGLKAVAAGLTAIAAVGGLTGLAAATGGITEQPTPGQVKPIPPSWRSGAPTAAPTAPSVPTPTPRPPVPSSPPDSGLPPPMQPLTSPIPRSTGPGGIFELPGKRSSREFDPETAAPYRVAGLGWQPVPTSSYLQAGDTAELRRTVTEVTHNVERLNDAISALALNTDASGAGALAGLAGRISAPMGRLPTLRGGGGGGGVYAPRGGGGSAPRRRPGGASGGRGGGGPDRSRTPPTTYQQSAADTQAIIAERRPFIEQLKDPDTRSLAAWAMREEQHDPNLRSDPLEALINRAVADNARRQAEGLPPKTLKQYLTDGFYGPVNDYRRQHGKLPQASEQQLRDFDKAETEVAGGSNRIRGRTDQGMKHEHKADPGGKFPVRGEYYSWHRGGTKYEKGTAAARAVPGQEVPAPPPPPQVQQQQPPSAEPPSTQGTSAAALDDALKLAGAHERKDRELIKQYLRSGGAGMDPARAAWCANFVNAALQRQDIPGTRSAIATSFLNWGTGVSGDPEKGDVLVQPRGRRAGQTGGHVGFATGRWRIGRNGQKEYEIFAGNVSNRADTDWISARQVAIRRAAIDPARAGKSDIAEKERQRVSDQEFKDWLERQKQKEQEQPAPFARQARQIRLKINLRAPRGIKTATSSSKSIDTVVERTISPADATGGGRIESPA